jgi:hypothetical protein
MHTDRCGNTRRQNVMQKEAGKKLKYKSLGIEIQRMWNLKCTIIPVIIRATGIVMKNSRKSLGAIAGKHSTDSLRKTAVLGTSHIIQKVLQCETWSLSRGNHCCFKRSTRKKVCDKRQQQQQHNNNNDNNNLMHAYIHIHKHTHTHTHVSTATPFPFVLCTQFAWVTGKEIYFQKLLGLLCVCVLV